MADKRANGKDVAEFMVEHTFTDAGLEILAHRLADDVTDRLISYSAAFNGVHKGLLAMIEGEPDGDINGYVKVSKRDLEALVARLEQVNYDKTEVE